MPLYRKTSTNRVFTREELANGDYMLDLDARSDVDPDMSMTFEDWLTELRLDGVLIEEDEPAPGGGGDD
jgi:hypothetical protein